MTEQQPRTVLPCQPGSDLWNNKADPIDPGVRRVKCKVYAGWGLFRAWMERLVSRFLWRGWSGCFQAPSTEDGGGDSRLSERRKQVAMTKKRLNPNHKLLFVVNSACAYRGEERWADGGFEDKVTGRMPTKCRPAKGGW